MNNEAFEIEKQFDLLDYFRTVRKRKWMVVFVALAVLGSAAWYTFSSMPVYEAITKIQVGIVPIPASVLERVGPWLVTNPIGLSEIEIIKSRVVAERTAMKLQRHYDLLPLPPGVFLEIAGVELADGAAAGIYTVTFVDTAGSYRVVNPQGRLLGVGRPGQTFASEGVSFVVSSVTAKPQESVRILLRPLRSVAEPLRALLSVEPVVETNLLGLKVKTNNPEEAARLANAFAESYVDFSKEQKVQHLRNMRRFVEKQIELSRKDILDMKQSLALKAMQKTGAESIVENVSRIPQIGSPSTANVNEPKIGLARRLFDLELARAILLYTYAADHGAIARIDHEIAALRNRLAKALGGAKEDFSLDELALELQLKLSTYNSMIQKQYDLQMAEMSQEATTRIIDRALSPGAPVSPNIPRNLLFGGILGVSLGIGLALLVAFLDRTIKDVGDVEHRLDLRAFGVIPEISGSKKEQSLRMRDRKKLADQSKLLIGEADQEKVWAMEAYRTLRTNIGFATPETPAPVFLITSGVAREGKSLTVTNLAIAISQMQRRVLLVDADLRKPVLHRLLGSEKEPGLSDLLAGKLPWQEAIRPSKVQNLDVIPSGRTAPNPTELLAGQAMGRFLKEARQHYDFVVVDTPPVLPFTDACIIAPLVDGVLLVVRAGVALPEVIERARSMLGAVNAKLIGAILNRTSAVDGFNRYRYYYQYDEDSERNHMGRIEAGARRLLSYIKKI